MRERPAAPRLHPGHAGLELSLPGFIGSHRSEVSFVVMFCPRLFQGRAGSDGARGMPGQTGPKVGCHSRPPGVLVPGHHHRCHHVDDVTA